MTKKLTYSRLGIVVFILVAGSGLGVGLTNAIGDAGGGTAEQLSPQRGTLPFQPTTAGQAISTLRGRLPDVGTVTVSSDPVPNEDDSGTTNELTVHVQVNRPTLNPPDIARASWESNLLVGALASAFSTRGFGTLQTVQTTVTLPDGTSSMIGSGLGNVVPDQLFNDVPTSIGQTVATNAALYGLRNTTVSSILIIQNALDIKAVADSPAQAVTSLNAAGGLDALLGEPTTDYEGVYLEVDDANGNPVYVDATAARDGATTAWADPSLGIQTGSELQIPG